MYAAVFVRQLGINPHGLIAKEANREYIALMAHVRQKVVLVQLPIPPVGTEPIRGNVALAAGYLQLMARQQGLEHDFDIEILPTAEANTFSDCGLVEAILARDPWLVGFTCYLWNIDRSLWVAERLKRQRPGLKVLLGGPEVTSDNAWVLGHPAVDFASIGEGEQTFVELLAAFRDRGGPSAPIDGLFVAERGTLTNSPEQVVLPVATPSVVPRLAPRRPLPRLDEISSPYLAGILDAADEEMLLLETIRGCVFKCKFCYYPKSYDSLYFLSRDKIVANLQHARERGAREVVLLDPTLNQRRDFDDFLRLLAEENPGRRFTYFGELRAEGITPTTARLLREANFTEVEIGLQSIDPTAQELMDRKNHLKAFERGVRALLEAGIKVKVDLIIGLPGDTVDSVRRSVRYLRESGLYSSVQVFNLAILPGTAFRQEAEQLGLKFSPRTPYYVLSTPTLTTADLFDLMQEAQEEFDVEFDPLPPPVLPGFDTIEHLSAGKGKPVSCIRINLDAQNGDCFESLPLPADRAQTFTLWLQSTDFERNAIRAADLVDRLLSDNPHTTLQIIVEPVGIALPIAASTRAISVVPSACGGAVSTMDGRQQTSIVFSRVLTRIQAACFRETSYLDRFYSILPGRPKGAKRIVLLLPAEDRCAWSDSDLDDLAEFATVVWREAAKAASPAPVYIVA